MAGKSEKTLFPRRENPALKYPTRHRRRNGLSLRTPLRGASILRGGFGRRGRILQTLNMRPMQDCIRQSPLLLVGTGGDCSLVGTIR